MTNRHERRDSDRFPMKFILEVSAIDNEGKEFDEKAVLKDISGGGAKLIIQRSEKYFTGQLLNLCIHLPGTDDVKAQMRSKATVVRIDLPNESDIGEKGHDTYVAVKLDTRLNFERININTREIRGEQFRNFEFRD